MQSIVIKTEILDENWQKYPPETPYVQIKGKPFVAHTFQHNEAFFFIKGKPTTKSYKIYKDDREISLPTELFKQIRQEYPELKVGQVFDLLSKGQQPKPRIKISEPRSYYARAISLTLAVITLIALPVGYGMMVSERNFGTMRPVTDVTSLSLGEFIETPMYIVDAFEITEVTTRKLYGVVETSKSESRGNIYLLGVADPDTLATYVYRYDPDSDTGKKLDAHIKDSEEIYFGKIQGEVKPLDEIEHVNQTKQAEDFFQETIDNYKAEGIEFRSPRYLIDGRVSLADIKVVYIGMAIISALAVVSLVMSFVSHRIYRKDIKRMALSLTKNVA